MKIFGKNKNPRKSKHYLRKIDRTLKKIQHFKI